MFIGSLYFEIALRGVVEDSIDVVDVSVVRGLSGEVKIPLLMTKVGHG